MMDDYILYCEMGGPEGIDAFNYAFEEMLAAKIEELYESFYYDWIS